MKVKIQTINKPSMTVQKCAICSRPASDSRGGRTYCVYHTQAYDGVVSHYKDWITAYGGLTWQEYLYNIVKMKESGDWIKEIAEAELQDKNEKERK